MFVGDGPSSGSGIVRVQPTASHRHSDRLGRQRGQEALGVQGGGAAGAGGGDRLTVDVVDQVAGGEDAGQVRPGAGGVHQHVAGGVQLDLAADQLRARVVADRHEQALDGQNEDADGVARAGAAFVGNVALKTTVLLLRLRHQLSITRDINTRLMLCEETVAVSIAGTEPLTEIPLPQARELLGAQASRNMPPVIRDRHIQQALDQLPTWQPALEAIAQARAQSLLADHRRVREAAEARGSYQVTASLPVDVMGVYVLVPAAVEV